MEYTITTKNKKIYDLFIQFIKLFELETGFSTDKKHSGTQHKFKQRTDKQIREFYNAIKVNTKNFKFDREKANER